MELETAQGQVWGVAVAFWMERLLLTPEVRGSNPIKTASCHLSTSCNLEKTKILLKEAGNDASFDCQVYEANQDQ